MKYFPGSIHSSYNMNIEPCFNSAPFMLTWHCTEIQIIAFYVVCLIYSIHVCFHVYTYIQCLHLYSTLWVHWCIHIYKFVKLYEYVEICFQLIILEIFNWVRNYLNYFVYTLDKNRIFQIVIYKHNRIFWYSEKYERKRHWNISRTLTAAENEAKNVIKLVQ